MTVPYNTIQLGDIACFEPSNWVGRAIVKLTGGWCCHVGIIIELGHRPHIHHAARGWFWHQSYISEPLDLGGTHSACYKIVRLKYGQLFDVSKIESNLHKVLYRSLWLIGEKVPYDWIMITHEGARFILPFGIGQKLTHRSPLLAGGERRTMCSEAVSGHIWNPAWMEGYRGASLSLFAQDPLQLPVWDTPREIAESKNVVTIWER